MTADLTKGFFILLVLGLIIMVAHWNGNDDLPDDPW